MFDVRSLFAAFRRGPGPSSAFERGVVALDSGDHEAAVREFASALNAADGDPARATIHNKIGVARMALGRPDDAFESFCTALDHDERCAAALVNVGNLFLEGGHPLDAIDYYEAALRADETYAAAYRNLGIALRRLGRRSEAVRALRSADRYAGRLRRSRA
jgi:tetratricopeptide (TPR) repeat protein